MYHHYFGLEEPPFSIAVNPRYLFMSARHRDALAHLLYGVGAGGGFILLTGEVGTGKTTINRALLEQLPDNTDIAIILNPALNARELLASVCDELGITYLRKNAKLKELTDSLHGFLLANHARGRQTVLLIDEAQHLDFEVLEQIRLLTNLETDSEKLLQIILIGQPELAQMLAQPELRQLNQRITARYDLAPLNLAETRAYIRHRLQVAGLPPDRELFPGRVVRGIYGKTRGIPRLINLLCDRILLGAYGRNRPRADMAMLNLAVKEVMGEQPRDRRAWLPMVAVLLLAVAAGAWWYTQRGWSTDLPLAWPVAGPGDDGGATVAGRESAGAVGPARAGPAPEATADAGTPMDEPAVTMGSLIEVAPGAAQPGAELGGPLGGVAGRAAAASPSATDRTPRGRSADPARTAPASSAATANAARTPAAWQMESRVALERLWSLYEDSPAPPGLCDPDVEPPMALACVSELARGWGEVRAFDRPLLLDLVREDGDSAGAVLLGIEGNSAMLLAGSGWRRVPLPELALRWSGEYRFLWRPPLGYRYPLALWADSPVVLEIAQMFARLDGQPAPLSGEVFNSALDARVRLFQERHGLAVDGVVGVRTLLKLNQALGTDPDNAEIRQSLALAGQ